MVSLPASRPLKLKFQFSDFVFSYSRDGFPFDQHTRRLLTTLQMNFKVKNLPRKRKPYPVLPGQKQGATGLTEPSFSLNASSCGHPEALGPRKERVIEFKYCTSPNTRTTWICHSSFLFQSVSIIGKNCMRVGWLANSYIWIVSGSFSIECIS